MDLEVFIGVFLMVFIALELLDRRLKRRRRYRWECPYCVRPNRLILTDYSGKAEVVKRTARHHIRTSHPEVVED